jgi:DNA-binding CsgD family transcriptional regulator/tetratricopeptide (TPR) repeat protein
VIAYAGDLPAGIEQLRSALRLAGDAADPDDLAAAAINLGHVLGMAGRHDEAVRVCLEGHATARAVGLEREHGSFLLANAAECLIRAGRWDEADELLADALAQAPRGLRAFPVQMQTAWLALRRGSWQVAAERLVAARALLDEGGGGPSGWRRELLEGQAELAAWERRFDDALAPRHEGLTLAEAADEQRFAGQLVATGLRAAADEMSRARAVKDARRADQVGDAAEALIARASRLQPNPPRRHAGSLPASAALAHTCAAEAARVRGTGDGSLWAVAADAWDGAGPAVSRWPVFAGARPRLCSQRARPTRVRRRCAPRTTSQRLRASAGCWRRSRGSRRGVASTWLPARMRYLRSWTSPTGLGLTPREREVLAHLTAGRTNGQIAEALFISVKTASVHVSNILRKLEVGGREGRGPHRSRAAVAGRAAR